MTLRDYLTDAMALDYREGQWDCVLFVARWLDLKHGTTFEESLRGTYGNKLEGLRRWRRPGLSRTAVSSIAAELLRGAGFVLSDDPTTGDPVGLEDGDIGIAWADGAVKLMPGRTLGMVPPDLIRQVWKFHGKGGEQWPRQ